MPACFPPFAERTLAIAFRREKLADYSAGGTPLVWVIDPEHRTVMIVARDAPVRWLRDGDTLDGGSLLPGFSGDVTSIFEGIARDQ